MEKLVNLNEKNAYPYKHHLLKSFSIESKKRIIKPNYSKYGSEITN